jgi:hypothetical protein
MPIPNISAALHLGLPPLPSENIEKFEFLSRERGGAFLLSLKGGQKLLGLGILAKAGACMLLQT